MFQPVTLTQLDAWQSAYEASPERRLATLALSRSDMNQVARVPSRTGAMRQTFSVEVQTLPVTNQEKSGRCWLFAFTNVLRENIAARLNVENFELSQSWLAFWDKFERCNWFLETMIDLADRPVTDFTVYFTLQTGVHDGGQWDMAVAVAEKYGLVPKSAFDETFQSANTRGMNHVLNQALKAGAARLRAMLAGGADAQAVAAEKERILCACYGFLCSCYGEPPKTFDLEYTDKDHVFHAERDLTPLAFAEKYAFDTMRSAVSVIHAPTADKPFHKTYTIQYLGNVAGGRPVKHLNLPLDELKAAIIRQLQDGRVVWFGSDVGHWGDREKGIWDDQSYDYELLTGLDLRMTKAEALDMGFSAMNHAMVLTGVHLVDGKPVKWKIENSWGDKNGEKGYYVCSDSWFDRLVYQAAIDRSYLGDLAGLADQTPVELLPWDPMGTLAD